MIHIFYAAIGTLVAVVIAVAVERLISHFGRRAAEEEMRLDLAETAQRDIEDMLDRLLDAPQVSRSAKSVLIDFAESTTHYRAAKALVDLAHGAKAPTMKPAAQARFEEFIQEMEGLKSSAPEVYDLYRTYVFRLPLTAISQWHDTYKAMGLLSMRLSAEREPAAARDAYVMRQSSVPPTNGFAAAA